MSEKKFPTADELTEKDIEDQAAFFRCLRPGLSKAASLGAARRVLEQVGALQRPITRPEFNAAIDEAIQAAKSESTVELERSDQIDYDDLS